MAVRTGLMERVLVVKRLFEGPASLVFKLWTAPQHLVRWLGPQGFATSLCEMEVRPGGAFRFCLRSPSGREHWVRGAFLEIVERERILFTCAWDHADGSPGHETLVTVTLVEQEGRTRLTLHQAVFESVTARDRHEQGWTGSLDRLAECVTGESGIQAREIGKRPQVAELFGIDDRAHGVH